ncbi:hypothetical protein BFJ68_g16412 [Fusarium oxysporum]|uniref:Uncharacterized protein n=1 Tax=Fusarium oxysporum TaxID=5507 RepID=A0A420PDG6_FUSOX|nr:hypothetical protein BFJ67_g16924 [Fusarium oxysporum f. sp. cepae]RKK24004.1 hypothetical protein BFJ66_g17270 [Fusarium oxysporum f. sp. cepae]RKK78778.1 hypothetical protein BFJ71_g16386 [Fusarium oxysporum]RKK90558.1 hypothetical protein BFJ68_g16412 [Fusarium oxysporum]
MGSKNAQAVEDLVLGASPQKIEQFKNLLRFFDLLAMATGFRINARLFLAALLPKNDQNLCGLQKGHKQGLGQGVV